MIKKVEEAKIVLACEDDPKPFTVIYERANEGLNSFKRPHIIDA